MSKTITNISKVVSCMISDVIKNTRIEQDKTMPDLQKQLGINSRQVIDQIENTRADNKISLGMLYALCMALKLEPRDILPSVTDVIEQANIKVSTVTCRSLVTKTIETFT